MFIGKRGPEYSGWFSVGIFPLALILSLIGNRPQSDSACI